MFFFLVLFLFQASVAKRCEVRAKIVRVVITRGCGFDVHFRNGTVWHLLASNLVRAVFNVFWNGLTTLSADCQSTKSAAWQKERQSSSVQTCVGKLFWKLYCFSFAVTGIGLVYVI